MRSRYWWLMVAAMIAGAVVCRTYLQAGKIWLANGYQHPICYLDRFAFGLLASKCGLRRQYATLGGAKTLGALMLGGVMLVGWAIWQYYATGVEIPSELLQDMGGAALFFQGVHRNRVHAIIQPLAFSAGLGALLLAAWLKPEPLGRWLRRTPLPWMGKVSYSTYLWHAPILLGLLRAAKRHPGTWMAKPWLALAGILFFVYLISWISYRGFEAPWLKRPKA